MFNQGFISHLIGHKTINIPETFSGVHGFTRTVSKNLCQGETIVSLGQFAIIIENGTTM